MNRAATYISEIYSGKTIYRIFLNKLVSERCAGLTGEVVDLAGGGTASYYAYLPGKAKIVRTNIAGVPGIDIEADLNKALPFHDDLFDAALLFNALYITEKPSASLIEIRRILRAGSKLYLAVPFVSNEMPEPHDYERWTAEGLKRLLEGAGFEVSMMRRMGNRFCSAAYLLHPYFVFNTVRLFVYAFCIGADHAIDRFRPQVSAAPLGYFIEAKKA
jgi:SAM-dependent methyltransferase